MRLVLPETIKAYSKPMLVNCLILIEEFLVLMRRSCYCSTPKRTIDFLFWILISLGYYYSKVILTNDLLLFIFTKSLPNFPGLTRIWKNLKFMKICKFLGRWNFHLLLLCRCISFSKKLFCFVGWREVPHQTKCFTQLLLLFYKRSFEFTCRL